MSGDQIPAELLALARQHGIDLDKGHFELSDAELEAVLGGKDGAYYGGSPVFGGYPGLGFNRPFWRVFVPPLL